MPKIALTGTNKYKNVPSHPGPYSRERVFFT